MFEGGCEGFSVITGNAVIQTATRVGVRNTCVLNCYTNSVIGLCHYSVGGILARVRQRGERKPNLMLYAFDNQQLLRFQQQYLANGEPTEAQLLAQIAKGNQAALDTLSRRHNALLRTIVSRVVVDDADVDEVVQDVLLDVWKNASHYCAEKGQALGWIVTVARRRAIDRVRRKQAYARAKERYHDEVISGAEEMDTQSADANASSSELRQIFTQVLDELPKAQREALFFNVYKGLSQREIAAKTGTPLGTIKTRLELALRKVRSAILAQGGRDEWMCVLMSA
jgi:RNA polymerase sigma-70 factor (ECF subfamily)